MRYYSIYILRILQTKQSLETAFLCDAKKLCFFCFCSHQQSQKNPNGLPILLEKGT